MKQGGFQSNVCRIGHVLIEEKEEGLMEKPEKGGNPVLEQPACVLHSSPSAYCVNLDFL